jgi:hypothetical protein
MIYNAKIVFLTVNASLCWLNNVSVVHLVPVSLLLIGQRSLGHFSGIDLAFHWLEDYINFTRMPEENNQYSANRSFCNTISMPIHFINAQLLYTPFVISRNNKNKQLTLLSQRKLAFTARNKLFAL